MDTDLATRNNDILRPILDRNTPVLVPDRQIPRMKPSAIERPVRRLLVLKIAVHRDITPHDDLPNGLAIFGHVDQCAVWVLVGMLVGAIVSVLSSSGGKVVG